MKGPALKTVTDEQLGHVIELGERIASGEVNLVELDERSLEARGKKGKYANFNKSLKATQSSSPIREPKRGRTLTVVHLLRRERGLSDARPCPSLGPPFPL